MKWFLFTGAMLFLLTFMAVFFKDFNIYDQHKDYLTEFLAEEVAAAAAQYRDPLRYAEGEYVFRDNEGRKAAEFILKKHLHLQDDLSPTNQSYWDSKDEIDLKIDFVDHSNFNFPNTYIFDTPSGKREIYLTDPTTLVYIGVGKGKYSLYPFEESNYVISGYTQESY